MPDTAPPQSEIDVSVSAESQNLHDGKPPTDYSLHISVRRLRAFGVSLLMAIALVGAMLPFAHDGVRLDTFQAGDMEPARQKKMLDKYNSISGGLTVLLTKPLDVVLSMVVTVTLLCIATKYSIRREVQRRYLVMGVIAVVGYLMNTGFSALNVQVVSGPIHPRIVAFDLAVENAFDNTQQLNPEGLLTTTLNASFREDNPGNSVLNTILRNLFVATEEVPTWCNHTDDYPYPFKHVVASYGFPPRTWQQYAIPRAIEPALSVSMLMSAATADLPPDNDLPMNQSVATNLVVYALLVSNSFLGWWGRGDEAWNFNTVVNRSGTLSMAEHFNLTISSSSNASFLSDAHTAIVGYFSKAENASITDELAKVEFTKVDVSDSIVFDALTIEIPTQKYGDQEDNSSSSNPFYKTLRDYLCNAEACLMPYAEEYTATGTTTTVYPRVQALAICLNDAGGEDLVVDFSYYDTNQLLQSCKQRSNTSMIVVSVGKRIEGDTLEAASSTDSNQASQIINARMVYSLTVGRLAWTFENLSETYDAECARSTGCDGIHFRLQNLDNSSINNFLLVSHESVPMNLLSPINMNSLWYAVGSSQWKILASTVEETRGAGLETESRTALIVLPRNFKHTSTSLMDYMNETGWENCEIFIDKHINNIEKNHLYIEHTLQPAYTAGLYFILQNAVVLKQLPLNASVVATKRSLQFSGNIQDMYVQASIPTTSLLFAVGGCILVVLGGITIAFLGKHGEGALNRHRTAGTLAEAIANQEKFPPFMLELQLYDTSGGNVALNSLRVDRVAMVNVDDESQLYVVGKM